MPADLWPEPTVTIGSHFVLWNVIFYGGAEIDWRLLQRTPAGSRDYDYIKRVVLLKRCRSYGADEPDLSFLIDSDLRPQILAKFDNMARRWLAMRTQRAEQEAA